MVVSRCGVLGRAMWRVLIFVGVILSAFGPATAEDLTPRAYTEKMAQALGARLPQRTVSVRGNLELSIKGPADGQLTLSLTNLFSEGRRDAASFEKVVNFYVGALTEKREAAAKLDTARIVPVVKDRAWLEDNHRELKARGGGREHVYEDLNKELVIVYAEDTEKRTRYLLNDDDLGVARGDLRKLAVDNLMRILPKIKMEQTEEFGSLTAGGDYEASLLLMDHIWSGGQIKVEGDIVVAVPAKNVLLITGSQNRKGLAAVRKLAAHFVAENSYRLTDTLFVYREGRFVKFGRK